MKFLFQRSNALTRVEVLCLVAILVLGSLLFPAMKRRARKKADRYVCVNNQKQIGLSFRLWAEDHGGQFPMQTSTNKGGVKELNETLPILEYFQLLTNELGAPKILFCPEDEERMPVLNFSDLEKTNCSYFIGVDAATNYPNAFLAGDRNITNGFLPKRGILVLTTNHPAGFTEKIHAGLGSIGFADGSIQQISSARLRTDFIPETGMATNRILLP